MSSSATSTPTSHPVRRGIPGGSRKAHPRAAYVRCAARRPLHLRQLVWRRACRSAIWTSCSTSCPLTRPRRCNVYGKGKYLLRHAFEGDWLPHDILMREKAAFTDAVGHSMVDDLKEYAESAVHGRGIRDAAPEVRLCAAVHQGIAALPRAVRAVLSRSGAHDRRFLDAEQDRGRAATWMIRPRACSSNYGDSGK